MRQEDAGRAAAAVARFPLPADVARELARGWEEGRRLHGELGLARANYDEGVMRLARARLGAARLGDDRLAELLAGSRLDDLYLTIACDRGVAGAWERFERGHRSRLIGLAVSMGAPRDRADEIVDLIFGDLCAPGESSARTRIGSFDGSGSLFGWLAVIVRRRVVDLSRARRHESLDADHSHREIPATEPDAATSLMARELAARMAHAVEQATARLTTREALALRLKFREDLPQRAIAGLMGVGEARVSRLVSAGVEKLRAAVREAVPEAFAGALATDAAWSGVKRALEVASFGDSPDLPRGP